MSITVESRASKHFEIERATGGHWQRSSQKNKWFAAIQVGVDEWGNDYHYLQRDGETHSSTGGDAGWFNSLEELEAAYDKWLAKQTAKAPDEDHAQAE